MKNVAILLVMFGAVIILVGLALLIAPKVPWLGRLPGDIHYRGRNVSFHFPLTTCIALSVVLTAILNLVLRLFRK
ncbi:MAG: DUF2905 domain-containing protein [Kiritimatiellia bacterium]